MDIPNWAWLVFAGVFAALFAVDLAAHRGGRADSRRSAIVWSVVWIAAGLAFALFVWVQWGPAAAVDYLGAYVIEKTLSVDNLFVFLIVFQMLNIPAANQRTVLSWGIFGALVLRGVFVFAGAAAIERFHGVVYVFGAILLWAAWRTFREDPTEQKDNRAVAWLSKHLPVVDEIHGNRFFVVKDGRRLATPLFLAVLGLELTDVIFAVDSVPAAFSITHEPFLVFTSNAFAILGLRALYIVLATTLTELKYLHYGLAAVLAFAAVKLMTAEWFHIPAWLSILIIAAILGASVWASLRARRDSAADRSPAAGER